MQAIGFSGTFASSGKVGVGPSAADWQDKLNQWHIARRNRLNAKDAAHAVGVSRATCSAGTSAEKLCDNKAANSVRHIKNRLRGPQKRRTDMLANRRQRSIKCSGALDVDDPSHELEPEISVKRDCPQAFYADCAPANAEQPNTPGNHKTGKQFIQILPPILGRNRVGLRTVAKMLNANCLNGEKSVAKPPRLEREFVFCPMARPDRRPGKCCNRGFANLWLAKEIRPASGCA